MAHFSSGLRPGGVPIAAALMVVVLSVLACAGSGVPNSSPAGSPAIGQSSTAAPPSIDPSSSIDPSYATSAAPSPAPLPSGTEDPLGARSIATVVVDALHLRAGPSTTTTVRKTLTIGTRLFVVGVPEVAGGMRWHQVSVIDPDGCAPECGGLGWVATPATDTNEWMRNTPVACPPSPMTAEELMKLLPLEQLHCYGASELIVTGWIDTPCCSGVSPMTYSPSWLAATSAYFRPRSEDGAIADRGVVGLHFPPGIGVKLPTTTVIVRATAHFDDPASSTCEASINEDIGDEEFDPSDMPSRAEMALYCRSKLVITDYDVVGYLPGGGCGCLPPSPKPAA